jgi:hypothetical protein
MRPCRAYSARMDANFPCASPSWFFSWPISALSFCVSLINSANLSCNFPGLKLVLHFAPHSVCLYSFTLPHHSLELSFYESLINSDNLSCNFSSTKSVSYCSTSYMFSFFSPIKSLACLKFSFAALVHILFF